MIAPPETLIIGGGLTGLTLAFHLQQAGHNYQLLEARNRFGGRNNPHAQGIDVDLGPSWFWPGQDWIARLLQSLRLETFEQYAEGAQLFQTTDGAVHKNTGFASMAGSRRIVGSTYALVSALIAQLDPARLHTSSPVTMISETEGAQLASGERIRAQRVILALPPRIAQDLVFDPVLPDTTLHAMASIPTWMAAHAKFVSIHEHTDWRDRGLSGDASSQRGPLVEMHDASPHDGQTGALFGFVGLTAAQRRRAGPALEPATQQQMQALYDLKTPAVATCLQDWSLSPYTAGKGDDAPLRGHPAYGRPAALQKLLNNRLVLAAAELDRMNGGLMEGAITEAECVASMILSQST